MHWLQFSRKNKSSCQFHLIHATFRNSRIRIEMLQICWQSTENQSSTSVIRFWLSLLLLLLLLYLMYCLKHVDALHFSHKSNFTEHSNVCALSHAKSVLHVSFKPLYEWCVNIWPSNNQFEKLRLQFTDSHMEAYEIAYFDSNWHILYCCCLAWTHFICCHSSMCLSGGKKTAFTAWISFIANSARQSRIFNESQHFLQCDNTFSTLYYVCHKFHICMPLTGLKQWYKKRAAEKDESNATRFKNSGKYYFSLSKLYIVGNFYVCDRRSEAARKSERKTVCIFQTPRVEFTHEHTDSPLYCAKTLKTE